MSGHDGGKERTQKERRRHCDGAKSILERGAGLEEWMRVIPPDHSHTLRRDLFGHRHLA